MSKDIQQRVIDVTGVSLMPGEPDSCLGNGEHGFECCCDECDSFLRCFPKFNTQSEIIDNATQCCDQKGRA